MTALIGVGAVSAWVVLAGATAVVAGRVIHERDAHDRPAARASRRATAAVAHR